MHSHLVHKAHQFFHRRLGVSLDALVAPVDPERPTGRSIAANGVYGAIREARREDDATLPMGAWACELKQADWRLVSEIAAHALVGKTKDLQLVAWLLEAQINIAGFAAIAACVVLMEALCERYWDALYPRIDEGDQEHRANILRWVNEKLLPPVRLLPVTEAGRGAREYDFADFEQARRNEQIRARQPGQPVEGVTAQEVQAALVATPTESHAARYRDLGDALAALESLAATLDRLWGSDAPGLGALAALLEQIQALIAAELYRRGVQLAAADDGAPRPAPAVPGGAPASDGGSGDGPIHGRDDAYRRLAAIADWLAGQEPHSPVPYLIRRAVEWGNMNTAELYHQIFLKFGGQLNVFELLGLETAAKPAP